MSNEETKETANSTGPKKKRKPARKDLTHRPKRGTSAFEYFEKEYRPGNNNGVSAEVAWKAMADEEKEPYLVMGGKAVAQELQRKWEIEFGKGYFVLEDGTKSTDDKNKTRSAKELLEGRTMKKDKRTD